MAPFQAKIGWKRLRNREIKNYRSISFLLDAKQKIPKKEQKNSKLPLWLLLKPKQMGGKLRKTENKNYRSDSFRPDA